MAGMEMILVRDGLVMDGYLGDLEALISSGGSGEVLEIKRLLMMRRWLLCFRLEVDIAIAGGHLLDNMLASYARMVGRILRGFFH